MDTLLVIRQNYSNFTPVEKKNADYIFEVEEQILGKSAQEVAKDLETSTAALVRFSRKLGYAGFSQLKLKLSASYAFHADDKKYYEKHYELFGILQPAIFKTVVLPKKPAVSDFIFLPSQHCHLNHLFLSAILLDRCLV